MRALVFIALVGCGRVGFDAVGGGLGGDDATGDGATSGDGNSSGATCVETWHTGPTFGAPVRIAELATADADSDPFVSDDGLTIYFSSRNGNSHDLFVATRTTPTGMFGQRSATVFNALNTSQNEHRPWLSPDERTVTYTKVNGSTGFDLASATRLTKTGSFNASVETEFSGINTSGADMDPAVSADGLRLYYSMPPQTNLSLSLATRGTVTQPFALQGPIAPLNHPSLPDFDPAPSRDELVMVFTSLRGGGSFDLYYAVRTSIDDAFGAPAPVPNVNSPLDEERDPYLSADGCTLYFASNRTGGAGMDDLYFAQLQ